MLRMKLISTKCLLAACDTETELTKELTCLL